LSDSDEALHDSVASEKHAANIQTADFTEVS